VISGFCNDSPEALHRITPCGPTFNISVAVAASEAENLEFLEWGARCNLTDYLQIMVTPPTPTSPLGPRKPEISGTETSFSEELMFDGEIAPQAAIDKCDPPSA
jgi:hypothetical protein